MTRTLLPLNPGARPRTVLRKLNLSMKSQACLGHTSLQHFTHYLSSQRAFRERKERHVKDLETKLADLESAQQQASVENQRLKADLQKMSTENEILRATGGNANHSLSPEPLSTGPMSYQPKDFYSSLLKGHNNQSLSHRIAFSDEGEKLFGAAATWDFIVNHDLYKAGLVNIGDVSQNLNHRAKCDGQGPVFAESTILDAIQQSVASGSDDLL